MYYTKMCPTTFLFYWSIRRNLFRPPILKKEQRCCFRVYQIFLTKLSNSSVCIMLKKPLMWSRAKKKKPSRHYKKLFQSLSHIMYSLFFFVECHCCDGFIALDPSAGQVRGATARLMSMAGNWQMEASISPLIRGSRSPPTDRVQLGNVVPASSHPVRFIKRSLIPRHNIINFVSGWTQWTSNLINFYHWMLEGRLNEINAQYFPARQPTLGVGLDCWQVRRCRGFGQLCLV